MKRSVFSFTLATVVAAGCVAVSADAASAQGARFTFAPNQWATDGVPKRSRYLQQQQPMTNVGHGSMPKASTFLGVDPTMLPKKPQPQVQTNAFPSLMATTPRVVPQKPAPFNPAFGAPPAVALQNPAPSSMPAMSAPNSQFGSPHSPQTTSQGVSARLNKPAQPTGARAVAHRGSSSRNVSGRLRAPARPTAVAATPKVMNYNNGSYTAGSTAPKASSSFHSTTAVSGTVLNHR